MGDHQVKRRAVVENRKGWISMSSRSACALLFGTWLAGCGVAQAAADSAQQDMLETFQIYVIQKMGRHEEAFALWLKAAERGSRQGILNAARMLAEGQGVPKDEGRALELYLKGAERGDADSMYEASRLIASGAGGAPDPERAGQLLRKAADAGSREAQTALARSLADRGETEQARSLAEKARDAGDPDARALLAALDAPAKVTVPPNVTQADIIRRMIGGMDRAANARDAGAYLDRLATDARAHVTLPDLPEAPDGLDAEAYRALWSATFAEAEPGYSFRREELKLVKASDDVKATSLIVETFPGRDGGAPTVLRLRETLFVQFSRGEPVIRAVELAAE
jgi:TPR repeat protein